MIKNQIILKEDNLTENEKKLKEVYPERIKHRIEEMNIEKVVRMIEDAKDLSYTKGESFNLIESFIKNFNNNYMIIKKVK